MPAGLRFEVIWLTEQRRASNRRQLVEIATDNHVYAAKRLKTSRGKDLFQTTINKTQYSHINHEFLVDD